MYLVKELCLFISMFNEKYYKYPGLLRNIYFNTTFNVCIQFYKINIYRMKQNLIQNTHFSKLYVYNLLEMVSGILNFMFFSIILSFNDI
jgi:hypothetical protein